jgi:putative ABC transport system permease protein
VSTNDPRATIAAAPMSALQVIVILITIGLNALDGFDVHLAIGATGRDVLALVLRRDLRIVLIGLGIGLVLSIGEGRLIENLSLPLPALGVLPVIGILVLLLAVAVTAIVVPATAALRVSPIQVLRQD